MTNDYRYIPHRNCSNDTKRKQILFDVIKENKNLKT